MKHITTILVAVSLLLQARLAPASVTLNLNVENLYGPTAGVPAPANSTVVLIASTQNATFGDLTQATNSFVVESDDIVIDKFPLGDGGVFQNAAFLDIDTTTAPAAGLSLNDRLLLVWYPNLPYSPDLTGPGGGQLFGAYRSDNATLASDIGWSVPANGTYSLGAYAESIGGDVPDILFTATQTTIGAPVNTPPNAICQDVIVSAGANCQASVTAAQVNNGSSDPDGDPITLTLTPAGPFARGTNNVTLTVADNRGGTNTCIAKVIVQDTTLPTITCPSNISTQLAPGQVSVIVNFPAPTGSDNCGIESLTSSIPSGSEFTAGTTVITNTAVDVAGNVKTCTFTVTVNPPGNQAPIAVCQDVVVSAGANCQASVTAAQVNNGSSDPDGDPITLTLTPAGPFARGTNNVTLTVADNRGGTNTCTAKVIVQDTTLPTIASPANVVVNVGPGQNSAVVTFPAPITGDNCGIASVTSVPASGSSFPVGATVVTNTVVDVAGNVNSCTFTVTVTQAENQPPVALCKNVTVAAGANCSANVTAAQVDNGSFDPDGTIASRTLSPAGPYAVGQTQVTLTVVDNLGATNTCTATITVQDTTPPGINCPANIVVKVAADATGANVEFALPAATDNCGIASVTATPASGSFFPLGATPVTIVAVDTAGNTNSCVFTVTVRADRGTIETIEELIAAVEELELDGGRQQSLLAQLTAAQRSLARNQTRSAAVQLNVFIKSVRKLEMQGKLDAATANLLIDAATGLIPTGMAKR